MNSIKAILDKSDYEIYDDFLNFQIDGYWLDEKLDELYPDGMHKGLVPTLVESLYREDEREVVWKRIIPKENETTHCPILMCPDDNDFGCTLVIAEVVNYGDFIKWKKIGMNLTNEWEAEKVGSKVEWFDKIGELKFEISDYKKMLNDFKERMELDKLENRNASA